MQLKSATSNGTSAPFFKSSILSAIGDIAVFIP
ncbi:hypothetical protein EBCG_00974 [Escherichia marmotae]|nr:hypothetical protein EBCG_00974 [Escherichia marmotae]